MQHQLKQWHLPLLIIGSLYCALRAVQCDAGSPFKNRIGGGSVAGGVMLNTANPATLLNPFLGSHGQTIRPQQQQDQQYHHHLHNQQEQSTYAFSEKYPQQYQSITTVAANFLPIPSFHQLHHNHHQKLFSPQFPTTATAVTFPVHQPVVVQQAHKRQFRNPFDVIYEWRQLDYDYASFLDRQRAILNGDFVPINNVPLGVDRWRNRLFVTIPRWKNGVPASLASLPLPALDRSPPMRPYPSWDWHANPEALQPDCTRLMSVYRIWVDECDRLWVLDAGIVNATIQINPVCPPKILVFDLRTDQPIFSYEFPPDQIKEDSLHSNLIVDIRNGRCNDAYAYVTDVWRFGILVFSLAKGRSWRTTHHFFYPNPEASDYTLNRLQFAWTDGVFGLSLSPVNDPPDRLLFFHPMSSYGEFMVSTSVLRNESAWTINNGAGLSNAFIQIGNRGNRGQSSTSGIDRNNVQFFTLIQQNAVGCWNTDQPYFQNSVDIVAQDNTTLVFPNDLKVDHEIDQGVWVLSNRLPVYLYSQLDYTDTNFRIQRASARDAILGTACDSSLLKQSLHTLA